MHPTHFNLHSAHLSLHPALCNTLNVIWTLISHILDNFPKFRPKNSKLSILTENWLARELRVAKSKSGLSFLKFGPQNPFLGKFVPKKSKLSVLPENWHTWYLEDAEFYSNISFWICNPKSILEQTWAKKSKLSILAENWHTEYLEDANSYSVISFLNFLPEIYFWPNLGRKIQSCLFCLKIAIWGIPMMLILVGALVF